MKFLSTNILLWLSSLLPGHPNCLFFWQTTGYNKWADRYNDPKRRKLFFKNNMLIGTHIRRDNTINPEQIKRYLLSSRWVRIGLCV